jgi:hypothetical protein
MAGERATAVAVMTDSSFLARMDHLTTAGSGRLGEHGPGRTGNLAPPSASDAATPDFLQIAEMTRAIRQARGA